VRSTLSDWAATSRKRHSLACALPATRATCGALWPELLALSASISLGAAMGVPYFTLH
jgi:hypothetical protein